LKEHPEIKRLSVEGHTDDRGLAAQNVGLSQRRAAAVVAWLVANGIDATRLTSNGFGATRPLESNAAEAGRQTNRRVEFKIMAGPPVSSTP
jgi:OOP family OmpA-OmpF porin